MSKLIAVIRREYLVRVRTRWFIVITIVAPLLMIGAMAIPLALMVRESDRVVSISVVDESGQLLQELLATEEFVEGRLRYVPPPGGEPEMVVEALRRQVLEGYLSGFLYIAADALEAGGIEYWGRDVGPTLVNATLEPATTTAVRRFQARTLGLEPSAVAQLTREVKVAAYRIAEEGVAREEGQSATVAHILALMIYMVVLLYGAMMLRAAVAEKASKTIEIILSSVRPWQLMLGKTLGVGAVGLTQVGIWLAVAGLLLLYAAGAQSFAGVEFMQNLPVGADTALLFLGLFLAGYFLYGGLYASVGAIASSEQEAAQLQLPVTLLVIIPLLIIPIVLESPTSNASVVLSWIPFFTPVLFMARYALGVVEVWEIPLIFTLQIVTILCVAWVGGRIYRVGLLMTGKRPTLPELVRWIRHG
ncbi:MAG: ABC transporter permease [Gemmatimonadota bacterium]|nr:MAG: ABC transporter permease [Gemmatimonadota bacterium]